MPIRPPEPVFYWAGAGQNKGTTLTVGLVRGWKYHRPADRQDTLPAFVCSADFKLPADMATRFTVVPEAEVGSSVAKKSSSGIYYETEIRMPEALACSLSGYVLHDKAVGHLQIGRVGAGVRRKALSPGTLIVSTQQESPFDSVVIVMETPGVKIIFKVVTEAQAGQTDEKIGKQPGG